MASIRAGYPALFERCQQTFGGFIHTADPRATYDVTKEEREAFWEKLYNEPGFGIWVGNFSDILMNREANAELSDFVARKIRGRVHDQSVADKLIPKNHGFGSPASTMIMAHGRAIFPDHLIGRGMATLNTSVMLGVACMQSISGVILGAFAPLADGSRSEIAYRSLFGVMCVVLVIAVAVYAQVADRKPSDEMRAREKAG